MELLVILKFAGALGLVLSLIGGCAFIANRLNLLSSIGARSGERRMKVEETLVIDAKHRMLIVKSDDREHVILTGPSGDLLVESREARKTGSDTVNHADAAAETTVVALSARDGQK